MLISSIASHISFTNFLCYRTLWRLGKPHLKALYFRQIAPIFLCYCLCEWRLMWRFILWVRQKLDLIFELHSSVEKRPLKCPTCRSNGSDFKVNGSNTKLTGRSLRCLPIDWSLASQSIPLGLLMKAPLNHIEGELSTSPKSIFQSIVN